jgi:hypothetical protein
LPLQLFTASSRAGGLDHSHARVHFHALRVSQSDMTDS